MCHIVEWDAARCYEECKAWRSCRVSRVQRNKNQQQSLFVRRDATTPQGHTNPFLPFGCPQALGRTFCSKLHRLQSRVWQRQQRQLALLNTDGEESAGATLFLEHRSMPSGIVASACFLLAATPPGSMCLCLFLPRRARIDTI
jgi:hypothetical protein